MCYQSKSWGLPLLSPESTKHSGPRGTAYHSVTLTEDHSARLLKVVKSKLGAEATVTHLAHAATVIALLRSQFLPLSGTPSHQEDVTLSSLFSPCWMNGRPYLLKDDSLPDPERSYIPVCQAMGQLVFHDLSLLQLDLNSGREDVVKALLACSKQATRNYAGIKARKSILSESLPLMDLIGDMMAVCYSYV